MGYSQCLKDGMNLYLYIVYFEVDNVDYCNWTAFKACGHILARYHKSHAEFN